MENVATTRKLIDVKQPVVEILSRRAKRKGVSLKRCMEEILEEEAAREKPKPAGVTSQWILDMIGAVRQPTAEELAEDDRMAYILSK